LLATIGLALVLTGFGLTLVTSLVGSQLLPTGLYNLWLGGRTVGFGALFPGLIITAVADFLDGYWTSGIILLLFGPVFLLWWVKLHQADQKLVAANKSKRPS
jgi:hypothetical protein